MTIIEEDNMPSIKILLVENEEAWINVFQERTTEILLDLGYSTNGFQIVCARDLPEAMKIMDAQAPWNLLLIDIRIPPWQDERLGIVLVRRAKYMRWATIAMTSELGQVTSEEEKYFKDNNIYFFDKDFLNKSEEYKEEIKKIVGKFKSKIEVFLSYAREDEPLLKELNTHLSSLKREQFISIWSDLEIGAGEERKKQIEEHLSSADVILLLVSSDFTASDFCWQELHQAIARHNAGKARVIPIILRPCDWATAPFGKLNPLPKDGKPVTSWPNQDEAFTDIARGIRKVAKAILTDQFPHRK